jgi:phosphatidylserine/phosphatidylglycerophosphate/cardiolipin synthase-like enzyme
LRFGETDLWSYPRISPGLIDRSLKSLGRGDRVTGAISHLKRGVIADALAAAAARGAEIELLVHDTERRVRSETLAALAKAGVVARRYARPDALPLHAKFLIVETQGKRQAWLGSLNFNRRSYWLNYEVLIGSRDPAVIDALAERYRAIADEVALAEIER